MEITKDNFRLRYSISYNKFIVEYKDWNDHYVIVGHFEKEHFVKSINCGCERIEAINNFKWYENILESSRVKTTEDFRANANKFIDDCTIILNHIYLT